MLGLSLPYDETHIELYNFNRDLSSLYFGYDSRESLKKSFQCFYDFLIKLDPVKLEIFINTNFQLLRDLSNELINLNKSLDPRIIKLDPNTIRSMYDKLFIKIINIKSLPENNITNVFREFIKGITYFKYQDGEYRKDPVYHRLFSCGDGKHSFRTELKITMNKTKLKDVSDRIKTCYIERLIYQELYLKNKKFKLNTSSEYSSPKQDKGHSFWLNQTNNDFNTCYPDINIKITLKYIQSRLTIPNYLMIRYFHKDKLISVEEYNKVINLGNDYYGESVKYKKTTKNASYSKKLYFSENPKKIKWDKIKKHEDNKLLFKLLNEST